ncbi:MAG TPA: ABC transporter substrate-binding protein, partial [Candidatus Omnitrophota bacterium]|nr:ABC transporter substrate-binding protein [Candidatus Omnitrophota bacterium]
TRRRRVSARDRARAVLALGAVAVALLAVAPFGGAARAADPVAPPASTAPPPPAAAPAASMRHYPPRRAAELKARLLEAPDPEASPGWALEFAASGDVQRLDPMTRAAEQLWAARIGLAGKATGGQRKELRSIVDRLESCPLDSVALKRAAQGIARVGVIVPLSGRYERYGKTFVNGLRIAVEEHNREFAPSISLVLYDSEGDPLVGARKARWLLKDHGVSLLIGELFTANTAPLAAATQVVGAVLLSPSATNERLATLGDAVFQLHVPPATLASALARYLKTAAPRNTAALLVAQTPDDSISGAQVAAACKEQGVPVVAVERVPDGTVDLTRSLAALKAKRAKTLVILGSPRLVGVAAPQIASAWPDVKVAGFESLDPEGLLREARDALDGASFFASDYALLGAPADSFAARYQRVNQEAPTRMSTRGYLVGMAVARAIESGCVNAAGLRETLRGQLYDGEEGRLLHALRPVIPAEPERLVVRGGKAIAAEIAP